MKQENLIFGSGDKQQASAMISLALFYYIDNMTLTKENGDGF